jgi:DNA repair exonuclease SbcCD ATPase subunit
MSDDKKDDSTPEVKLDAAGGFMPDPPPPSLSPEEAGIPAEGADGEIQIANTMPDGSVAVPHDTAKRALEAVQILVENNRAASQQLESLMSIVLDAAEVANRSAAAVATTGGHVNKAAEKLIDGAKRTSMQAKLILGITGAILVGTAGVFSFMSVQLQNKVAQLDEMMLAVGKRAVDLKRRMESMDDIHTALEELKLAQETTHSVQAAIEEKIARISEAPKAAPKPEPKPAPAAAPAKPVSSNEKKESSAEASPAPQPDRKAEARAKAELAKLEAARAEAARAEAANKALLQQLTALDGMLKDQSKAVKDLSGQFNRLQGSVSTVEGVKKDVEVLAQQQKQREKEMSEELAAEKARREKELKDKERELARERERAREREAAKERELAREREAAKERQAAAEAAKARDANKDRVVSYARDQSKPNNTVPGTKVPAYSSGTSAKPE